MVCLFVRELLMRRSSVLLLPLPVRSLSMDSWGDDCNPSYIYPNKCQKWAHSEQESCTVLISLFARVISQIIGPRRLFANTSHLYAIRAQGWGVIIRMDVAQKLAFNNPPFVYWHVKGYLCAVTKWDINLMSHHHKYLPNKYSSILTVVLWIWNYWNIKGDGIFPLDTVQCNNGKFVFHEMLHEVMLERNWMRYCSEASAQDIVEMSIVIGANISGA